MTDPTAVLASPAMPQVLSRLSDPRVRWEAIKRTLLWAAITAALVGEVGLLWFEVPDHLRKHQWLLHVALAVVIVLLPLTAIASLARLPIGRPHFKRRFIIRPFRTLKKASMYDGEAIAVMFYRRVFDWRLARSGGHLETSAGPEAKVNIAGTSFALPVSWFASLLRYFLTGERDVVINGLLEDDGDWPRLRVWVENSPGEWLADLNGEAFRDKLEQELARLSREVLAEVEPELFARICRDRGQYDRAMRVLEFQQPSSAEIDQALVEIDLERDYGSRALKRIDQFSLRHAKIGKELGNKLANYRAEALTKAGRYEQARKIILAQMATPSSHGWRSRLTYRATTLPTDHHVLRARLADTYFYQEAYEAALEEYRQAENDLLREAMRILGDGSNRPLQEVLTRCENCRPSEELDGVLWELFGVYDARAQTQRALDRATRSDYDHALDVLEALRTLGLSDRRSVAYQAAVIRKKMGQHAEEPLTADAFYGTSIELYDECIEECKTSLAKDDEDLDVRTDLAWSTHGRLACLQGQFEIASRSVPLAEGSSSFEADAIAQLMRFGPQQGDELLALAVMRASELSRSARDSARLSFDEAVAKLVDRITAAVGTEYLERWLGYVRQSSPSDEPESSAEVVEQQTSESRKDAPREPVPSLSTTFASVLHDLVSREADQSLQLIALAVRKSKRDEAQRDTWEQFSALWEKGEKYQQAEAEYGMACFHAVLCETDEAVAWLEQACASTRAEDGFSGYRNRARLDADLDGVRKAPAFRRLVYGEGEALTIAEYPQPAVGVLAHRD